MAVMAMAVNSTIISTRAAPGLRRPKKTIDQSPLRSNCNMNRANASHTLREIRCRHSSQTAAAISRERVDQTGPKPHGGGVAAGLSRPGYHVFTELAVNADPLAATAK